MNSMTMPKKLALEEKIWAKLYLEVISRVGAERMYDGRFAGTLKQLAAEPNIAQCWDVNFFNHH